MTASTIKELYRFRCILHCLYSSPAFAAANGPYVGIEGGVTFPQSTDLDVILNNTSTSPTTAAARQSHSGGTALQSRR